jgi:polyhydroxybutyrate depolymerase
MAPELAEICTPQEPVAVLDIHGTKDRIVPYEGGSTRGGGDSLSAEVTVARWRRINQCSPATEVTLEEGDVQCTTFRDCAAPVALCRVEGGGHTWPGGHQYLPRLLVGPTNRDVDASEMIWQFFAANPKACEPPRGSRTRHPVGPKRKDHREPDMP